VVRRDEAAAEAGVASFDRDVRNCKIVISEIVVFADFEKPDLSQCDLDLSH
jgi:hypothetical protein